MQSFTQFTKVRQHDWIISIVMILLIIIGALVIFSSTFRAESEVHGAGKFEAQLVFIILGLIIYVALTFFDYSWLRFFPLQAAIYTVIILLLLYLLLFAKDVRGTARWIELGFTRLQPSEYAKLVLVVLNAALLSDLGTLLPESFVKKNKFKIGRFKFDLRTLSPVWIRLSLSIVVSALVILLVAIEPALGNALALTIISFVVFFIAFPNQLRLAVFLGVVLLTLNAVVLIINLENIYAAIGTSLSFEGFDVGLIVVSLLIGAAIVLLTKSKPVYVVAALVIGLGLGGFIRYGLEPGVDYLISKGMLHPYQRERFEVFLNPEEDPQGAGWQVQQSKIAIGSGRLFGKGFLQGSQSKLRYLPEAYTDFVFAAYSEEFGFVGAMLLIILYFILIIRIILVAQTSLDRLGSLVCVGVGAMILYNFVVNISTNVGLLPVTGVPLPLVSYGGNSVMVTMLGLGLVQSVASRRDIIDMDESLVITSGTVKSGE